MRILKLAVLAVLAAATLTHIRTSHPYNPSDGSWSGMITATWASGVAGTFTVPSIPTTTTVYQPVAIWAGLNTRPPPGESCSDWAACALIQAGVLLAAGPPNPPGTLVAYDWFATCPYANDVSTDCAPSAVPNSVGQTSNLVAPGDRITITIEQTGDRSGDWVVAMSDPAEGWWWRGVARYPTVGPLEEEWITEAPGGDGGAYPLPAFTPIRWTGLRIAEHWQWTNPDLSMANRIVGTHCDRPSGAAPTGDTFVEIYPHNC